MADLISRQAALAELEERFDCHQKRSQRNIGGGFVEVHKEWAAMAMGVAECLDVVRKLSAIDAVEVVRCKECERRGDPGECPMCFFSEGDWDDYTNDNGFCERGERREENAAD